MTQPNPSDAALAAAKDWLGLNALCSCENCIKAHALHLDAFRPAPVDGLAEELEANLREAQNGDGMFTCSWSLVNKTVAALRARQPAANRGGDVEADDFAELHRLYNFADDDSRQFTRWQMQVALRHGKAIAAMPAPTVTEDAGARGIGEDDMTPTEELIDCPKSQACPDCSGEGQIEHPYLQGAYGGSHAVDPPEPVMVDCETCDGTGKKP